MGENVQVHELAVTTTVPGFMTAAEVISKLRVKYHGKTYDVSTPTGMKDAVESRRELRDARISLDKAKPVVKREALDFCAKVEADYKSIRAAICEYEDVPDAAITAVEEAKKREAAERQAKLDLMINNIIKLPLTVVGKSSKEIVEFLDIIEPQEFGAEFQGETLARAKAAKEQALIEIRHLHATALVAEESAARIKADQEAAELRMAEEKKERDRLATIEREEMAKREAAAAEQKRVNDIEAARLKKIADEEAARMKAEREAFEAEQAEARRIQKEADDKAAAERAELDRIAKEKADAEAAEKKRVQDEADEKRRQEEHAAAVKAEKERKEAEAKAKAAEKAQKLAEAKCTSATEAFKKIRAICRDDAHTDTEKLSQIDLIAEAMS